MDPSQIGQGFVSSPDDSFSDEIITWLAESNVLGWGALMLPDGPRVRVKIRELDGRRCACFIIPSGGLERMTADGWPEWLGSRGLARCTRSSIFSVSRFFCAPERQHVWEVAIRLRDGGLDEATCLLPVIPFHPFMAWRGANRGDIVEFDDGPVPPLDGADAPGRPSFDSHGHELFVRLLHRLLPLASGSTETICFDVIAVEGEPFDMGITSGQREITVTAEFRRLLAHFYEWTEYCQGIPWSSMSVELYEQDGVYRYYLELDYKPITLPDDDRRRGSSV